MRLEIENQFFFFNLVNKGHKVDIFNKEISSIDFFCSRRERVNGVFTYMFTLYTHDAHYIHTLYTQRSTHILKGCQINIVIQTSKLKY